MIKILLLLILIVCSYPFSHYIMRKGMTLDLSMPGNNDRYKRLSLWFRIPIINVVIMLVYLIRMLHKFNRV